MKKNFLYVWLPAFAMAVILSACSSDEPSSNRNRDVEPVDVELSPSTRALAKTLEPAYVKYTADMIGHIRSLDPGAPQLATSPLSATMLMALIANASDVEAAGEITNYLGTDNLADLNTLCKELLTGLPKVHPDAKITLANSIWVNRYFNLSPTNAYLSILGDYFDGKAFNYDFNANSDKLIRELKKWFSDNSGGVLADPAQQLVANPTVTIAILINALYFKSSWNIFKEEDTRKGVFHGANVDVLTDMMNSCTLTDQGYYRDNDFEIFTLPFANGGYHLHVVLPAENLPFEEAVKKFTPELVESFKNEYVRATLQVTMPKFNIGNTLGLSPMLASQGVSAFTVGKNYTMFDNSVPDDAFMTVNQNVSFSIDEKGAEAAAVSSGELMDSANLGQAGQSYTVTVDRPFIFYLTERSTQAWIVSGFVADFVADFN